MTLIISNNKARSANEPTCTSEVRLFDICNSSVTTCV